MIQNRLKSRRATQRHVRILPVGATIFVLALFPLLARAQAPVCPTHKPLTLVQVNGLIAQKIPDDRIAQRIESCKVSFSMDANTLDQLAESGASSKVVDALNRVTASDLTLSDAQTQVTALEERIQQVDAASASARDQALAKFDADTQTERQKASQIDPKGEFESTAEYNKRKQINDAKLVQFDQTRRGDRAQLAGSWATKASEKRQPYRARIDFLQAARYPDPRPILYKSYDPDTLLLTATLDGEEYRFEKVSSGTAQTLKANWPRVKVAQPFAGGSLQQRFLLLAAIAEPIAGFSAKSQTQSKVETSLNTARSQMNSRNYDAAAASYRQVLALDPTNTEAKDALSRINAIQSQRSVFLQGLTGAGIWLDPKTQLLWTIKDSDRTFNYQQASEYCQTLTLNGVTGWQLPSNQQLLTIYDRSVTKYTKKSKLGDTFFYRLTGPIELRDIFLWSGTVEGGMGYQFIAGDKPEFSTAALNEKWGRRALCLRPYNPADDGVAEGAAPSSASTTTTLSAAPPSTANLADDSKQATTLYDTKHFAQAAPLYERTCAGGNIYDCDRLGYMYSNGLGVAKDNSRAKELETKACDRGNPYGCNNLGFIEQTEKDYESAATHLTLACAGSNPNGCASLAFQYEGGLGVPKDISKAKQLYNRGCKLGYQWACEQFRRLN